MTKSNKQAFTLIELLVVVLIIGILAAIAVPQYKLAVTKARYMNMAPLLSAIKKAQEVYFLANGEYTLDLEALDVSLPGEAKPVSGENKKGQYKLGDVEIQTFYSQGGDKCPGRVGAFHVGTPNLEMHYYYDHASCKTGGHEDPDNPEEQDTSPLRGKRVCVGYGEAAKKVCRSVGTRSYGSTAATVGGETGEMWEF
ncbi:MAG: prepilin-type N-terminal cleavage/methylation domain-containing protein [Elusimicrobiaceae bacterium]|nr:prepilin-type N-terminal cleavage/methylation domain-containing protein [Elusimicrobiaceae bacterium]